MGLSRNCIRPVPALRSTSCFVRGRDGFSPHYRIFLPASLISHNRSFHSCSDLFIVATPEGPAIQMARYRVYLCSLFALLGVANALKVGDPCSTYASPCDDGSRCDGFICGAAYSYCSTGSQCVSGKCEFDHSSGRLLCTPAIPLGGKCTNPDRWGRDPNCAILDCGTDGLCGGIGMETGQVCDKAKTGTCETDRCFSGLQVAGYCANKHSTPRGGTCVVSAQCPVGISCNSGYCGKQGECAPDDTTKADGPSSICGGGSTCINNRCFKQVGPRGACSADNQCVPGLSCLGGQICGGNNACVPDDQSKTGGNGAAAICGTGNTCASFQCLPIRDPGAGCTFSGQCTQGRSCQSGICGGPGACTPNDSSRTDGTGKSTTCDYNDKFCLNFQCTAFTQPTYPCTINDQCPTGTSCQNGICDGPLACRPDDSNLQDGPSSKCVNGDICINNRCRQPYYVGQPCDSPYLCGNADCVNVCGGLGSRCVPDDANSLEGDSVQCVSNFCSYGSCSDDKLCKYDGDCFAGQKCGTGGCGKEGAACVPNSPSGDKSGVSDLCSAGYAYSCYNGFCARDGTVGKGGSCDSNNRCSPELHCTDGTCTDTVPPNPGDFCYDDADCVSSVCTDFVCTLSDTAPAPGSSDKPARRDVQSTWVSSKCPRSGQIACPIGSRGNADIAYEVGH